VPLSFTASSTSPASAAVDLLAVPVAKGGALGPGADAVDAALGGGLAAFLEETGFDGGLGTTLAVPTAASSAPRPRSSWASAIRPTSPSTGCAAPPPRWRSGPPRPRRSPRRSRRPGPSVGPPLDAAAAAQAVTEGFALGGTSTSTTRADAKPSKLRRVTSSARPNAR